MVPLFDLEHLPLCRIPLCANENIILHIDFMSDEPFTNWTELHNLVNRRLNEELISEPRSYKCRLHTIHYQRTDPSREGATSITGTLHSPRERKNIKFKLPGLLPHS